MKSVVLPPNVPLGKSKERDRKPISRVLAGISMSALLITVLVAVLSVTALFVTLPLLSQSCSEQPAIDCYYQDLQHPVTNVAAQWWYTIEIAGQLYYLLIAVGLGISWLFGLLSGLSRRQISYLVGLTAVVAICVAVPLLAFQDEIGLLVWYVE